MATDPVALVTQLNQIRASLTGGPTAELTPDLLGQVHGLAGQVRDAVDAAKASLEQEIHALAADLRAKAAAMRKPPAAPPLAPAASPHPWEEHQGLDAAQLQGMVTALLQQGKPHP